MASPHLKIFLADDDDDDRALFGEALNSIHLNCDLVMVNNGEKVLDYFLTVHDLPDFVFLDINMPKKNGLDCLRLIKDMHPKGSFHIIMLSTTSSQYIIDQSYLYGASIYIQKPSRFNELVLYLNYCLKNLNAPASRELFLLNEWLEKKTH